jgi:hypothetical protein
MAETRTLVTTFRATEDMDASLRGIERSFRPGERGEVVFKLDRAKAQSAGRTNITNDAKALSEDLEGRGMIPWDDHDLVELDWASRVFRIRFVQARTPSSMYQTPSFFAVAMIAARGAAAVAPAVVRGGFLAKFGRFTGSIGSRILRIGRSLTRSNALSLVGTGLLVWSLIDVDSLVEVFKWAGKKVAKAAGGLAKGLVGTPILIGIGVMVVGLFLVSRRQ